MESLKDVRVNKGLTLDEAAEKLGVSKNTLIKWENARDLSTIKVGNAIRIIDVYGLPLNFFATNYHDMK